MFKESPLIGNKEITLPQEAKETVVWIRKCTIPADNLGKSDLHAAMLQRSTGIVGEDDNGQRVLGFELPHIQANSLEVRHSVREIAERSYRRYLDAAIRLGLLTVQEARFNEEHIGYRLNLSELKNKISSHKNSKFGQGQLDEKGKTELGLASQSVVRKEARGGRHSAKKYLLVGGLLILAETISGCMDASAISQPQVTSEPADPASTEVAEIGESTEDKGTEVARDQMTQFVENYGNQILQDDFNEFTLEESGNEYTALDGIQYSKVAGSIEISSDSIGEKVDPNTLTVLATRRYKINEAGGGEREKIIPFLLRHTFESEEDTLGSTQVFVLFDLGKQSTAEGRSAQYSMGEKIEEGKVKQTGLILTATEKLDKRQINVSGNSPNDSRSLVKQGDPTAVPESIFETLFDVSVDVAQAAENPTEAAAATQTSEAENTPEVTATPDILVRRGGRAIGFRLPSGEQVLMPGLERAGSEEIQVTLKDSIPVVGSLYGTELYRYEDGEWRPTIQPGEVTVFTYFNKPVTTGHLIISQPNNFRPLYNRGELSKIAEIIVKVDNPNAYYYEDPLLPNETNKVIEGVMLAPDGQPTLVKIKITGPFDSDPKTIEWLEKTDMTHLYQWGGDGSEEQFVQEIDERGGYVYLWYFYNLIEGKIPPDAKINPFYGKVRDIESSGVFDFLENRSVESPYVLPLMPAVFILPREGTN